MTTTHEASDILTGDRPEPLWSRVADSISEAIADGRYPVGARLPAERELCQQLDVSRVTLRRALQHLVQVGALTSHQGRGWFVGGDDRGDRSDRGDWPSRLESFSETAARLGLTPSSSVLTAARELASIDDAETLAIAPGTPLLRLKRVRRLDGVPTALDTALVPESVAPDLLEVDFTTESLYSTLAKRGAVVHRAESVLEARPAHTEASAALGIPAGAPMLVIRQIVLDDRGRTVLLSIVEYAGDRYRLRTTFNRGA